MNAAQKYLYLHLPTILQTRIKQCVVSKKQGTKYKCNFDLKVLEVLGLMESGNGTVVCCNLTAIELILKLDTRISAKNWTFNQMRSGMDGNQFRGHLFINRTH